MRRLRFDTLRRRAWRMGALAVACSSATAWGPAAASTAPRLRALLIVIDGLRPDHISSTATPTLDSLATLGVVSSAHHAVYPTVTRVNATSLATGALPQSHGILDNTIFLPTVDSAHPLNTGDARALMHADSVLGGQLITVPTIHEMLAAHGLRAVVASAGSSGSAYLLAGAGRAPVLATDFILPATLDNAVRARLGPPPGAGVPSSRLNEWAVDALLRVGIDSLDADVGMLWLTDPDHSVHRSGLGSTTADSVIRAVDRSLARLIAGLATRGVRERVDIVVVSDHGFSTHAGDNAGITRALAPFRDQIVVAGSAIYLRAGTHDTRSGVVQALLASPDVGAVFTEASPDSSARGSDDGTFPFASVGWAHARAGDILFSANWSHARNAAGIAGWTAQRGVAGHGTTSPYDIGATFIATGPHFKQHLHSRVPSANSDIAPTLLALLGVDPPAPMTGRVLREVLRGGPGPERVSVRRQTERAGACLDAKCRRVEVVLHTSTVGTTRYLDSTVTHRTP